MKAFINAIHNKGMKVGIYSDPAKLTCAGYTGSLHFVEQDAKTFTSWGVDYLKYDYCNAQRSLKAEKKRYKKMADALRNSGRDIVFSVCEEGVEKPWLWAAQIGGQLWRTTYDIRDKWKNLGTQKNADGILDNMNINANLAEYAGPGHWNNPDMLVVGLYGKGGPSSDRGGVGCTNIEYQSQMSLWCMMAAPLLVTCDIPNMNDATKNILLNKDIIAIDQDPLGKQAVRKINNKTWNVFVKPLSGGDYAIGVLNLTNNTKKFRMDLNNLGLHDKYSMYDVWEHKMIGKGKKLNLNVASHETRVLRLSS
jgi:alpha-galactosidase